MASTYVPSKINPGRHFGVYVWKSQGSIPYAYAIEGQLSFHDMDSGRVTGFQTMHPGSISHRVNLTGNNTKGNRRVALAKLRDDLIAAGWVDESTPFPTE